MLLRLFYKLFLPLLQQFSVHFHLPEEPELLFFPCIQLLGMFIETSNLVTDPLQQLFPEIGEALSLLFEPPAF